MLPAAAAREAAGGGPVRGAPGRRTIAPMRPLLLVIALATGPFAAAAEPPVPPATGPAVTLDRIAAVVGDEIVLEGEVSRLEAIGFLPRREGETELAYRDRLLDLRVVELLREKELRLLTGLEPEPAVVAARLDELAARYEAGTGEPFDRALERSRTTRDEVKGWIRRGIALESYARERLLPTVKATEEGARAFYDGPFRAEAAARGVTTLPPFADVEDQVRDLLRERLLNEEVERWTKGLREKTRVVVYRRPPIVSPSGSASR